MFEIPGIFGGSEFRSGISFGYREDAGAKPVYKQNVRVTPPPPPPHPGLNNFNVSQKNVSSKSNQHILDFDNRHTLNHDF